MVEHFVNGKSRAGEIFHFPYMWSCELKYFFEILTKHFSTHCCWSQMENLTKETSDMKRGSTRFVAWPTKTHVWGLADFLFHFHFSVLPPPRQPVFSAEWRSSIILLDNAVWDFRKQTLDIKGGEPKFVGQPTQELAYSRRANSLFWFASYYFLKTFFETWMRQKVRNWHNIRKYFCDTFQKADINFLACLQKTGNAKMTRTRRAERDNKWRWGVLWLVK